MSDDELNDLIDRLKPDLRQALRGMLAGELAHAFDLDGTKDGEETPVAFTIFLVREPVASFLSSAICAYDRALPPEFQLGKPRGAS
jgi:hypothetical protein